MNITKTEMVDFLHRKNLVPSSCEIEQFTKKEIAERIGCPISATGYISISRFYATAYFREERREQI